VNDVNRRFIAMPLFVHLKQQRLQSLDVLTYVAIRSFYNTEDGYGYPPYEKIMERSGLGRTFLAQSIKRLELAGYLNIKHSNRDGTCNQYKFGKLFYFERVPYEFLNVPDLTKYEKAILLCIRQFFHHGLLQCAYDTTKLSDLLGLSYNQVYKPLRALIDKGYVAEWLVLSKKTDSSYKRMLLTNKLDWRYQYKKPVPVAYPPLKCA